ncbi:MAG: hypothetical protein H0V42_09915 [Nocardioidaceae bacterium]|nr:hypothetical protein [Nocardioidaceae bacterium]
MTGLIITVVLVIAVAAGLWLWRSSATRFPSDETLRHPPASTTEPLIRPASQHFDAPAAADIEQRSGREHKD